MSTSAWTSLTNTVQKQIASTVRTILQQIRQVIRHGMRKSNPVQESELRAQAWSQADLSPLISLLGHESLHPNVAMSKSKSIIKAYERLWEETERARAAPAAATENINHSNSSNAIVSVAASSSSSSSSSSVYTPLSGSATLSATYTCPAPTCAQCFKTKEELDQHHHVNFLECPVCFGHRGQTHAWLSKHADTCEALPENHCYAVCEICRTTTQHSFKKFQSITAKDYIKHAMEFHSNMSSTQTILETQRFLCKCGRNLIGKDLLVHRCNFKEDGQTVFFCNCRKVLPKVKRQHRWHSEEERNNHIKNGGCIP
jgi:hypothetical protein|tara:strand:- start:168 stop:1109 length:942 start_codon:yes stop_codon:yes gene_type:complete